MANLKSFLEGRRDFSAIVSQSSGTSMVDEKSVQQTPQPQAFSTVSKRSKLFQNQRIQDLMTSFYQRASCSDQSSLGLLPQNILEFSSEYSLISKEQNDFEKPLEDTEELGPSMESADDVFEAEDHSDKPVARQAGDGEEAGVDQIIDKNISTMTCNDEDVEFSAEQISARSSTTDGRLSESARPIRLSSDLLEKLFRRHSLDLTAFAASPVSEYFNFEKSNTFEQTEMPTTTSELLDTRFLSENNLPGSCSNATIVSDGSSFVTGDAVLEIFAKDEDECKKNYELMIDNSETDNGIESHSWALDVDRQNITRPSWMSTTCNNGQSRVSIGEFMRGKTENLGTLKFCSKQFEPLKVISDEEVPESSNNSIVSESAISLVMGDASFHVDARTLATNVLSKMTKSKQSRQTVINTMVCSDKNEVTSRAEPSGASVLSEERDCNVRVAEIENFKSVQQRQEHSSGWAMLQKQDKNVQVSFFESPPSQLPLQNFPESVHEAFVCKASVNNNLQSSPPVVLHLLQPNSKGRRPSLALPTSLVFAEHCCVGSTMESYLPVQNPTTQWLEGNITLFLLKRDGHAWSTSDSASTVFDVENYWTMEPNASKQLKVIFCPPSDGKWIAHMKIACRLRTLPIRNWCPVSNVVVEACAESPEIEIFPSDILDFGAIPEECLFSKSIQILNKSKVLVPVRLVIDCIADSSQCFFFSNVSESKDVSAQQIVCSSIMRSVLKCHANKCEEFVINLKAPSISKTDDDIQVLRTNLRIELDVSGVTVCLGTVLLKVLVGAVRLYTRQDTEPLPVCPTYDLPVQNKGPIPVSVALSTKHPELLLVSPSYVCFQPKEQTSIRITNRFPNMSTSTLNSILQMKVLPEGHTFEIFVRGSQVQSTDNETGSSILHSNRQYVNWGAVALNKATETTVMLYNTSSTETLHLSISIIEDRNVIEDGRSSAPFHLIIPSGVNGVKFVRSLKMSLPPSQKLPVAVYFMPISVDVYSGVLVIKPSKGFHYKGNIKFSIPLRGYGGVTDIQWNGVAQAPADMKYCDWIFDHKASRGELKLMAKNCGQRAAYVKLVSTREPSSSPLLPLDITNLVTVHPSQFVLKEGEVQHVTVVCDSLSTIAPFYVGIFTGDEMLRKRCGLSASQNSSFGQQFNHLENLLLKDSFLGENTCEASLDYWPLSKDDVRNLISDIKTKWVTVMPSVFNSYEEEPSRVFRALIPEQTLNETAAFTQQSTLLWPPTEHAPEIPIQLKTNNLTFPKTRCGLSSVMKLMIRNISQYDESVNVKAPSPPFIINHTSIAVKHRHYLSLPVYFRPQKIGTFSSSISLQLTSRVNLHVKLSGESH